MNSGMPPASNRTAGRLGVRLLGGFAVSIDGVEVPAGQWPALRAAHLVQLLSLQPRYGMNREQVIDTLWPTLEPEAGAANLRKAVHYARQALGRPDAMSLQGGMLTLWPDGPVEVDAETFERQAEAALRLRDAGACADAAALCGGELLPAARYEPWADAPRERLRLRWLELLRASAQWERLAALEPTDEPAHRALMARELDAGNRAAAVRWYARLRDALQHTLGVLPDAQTEALYRRCVEGLQVAGPAFVGRLALLAQAAAWLSAPVSQRTGGIVLRAPAGMGKSALCREIAGLAGQRGWQVLRVDVAQTGRAYAVTTQIAERLLLGERALLERIGPAARAVLTLLTPLAGPTSALPGPLGRHQVVGAVRRLLLAATAERGMLLQVDDAHLLEDADVDVLMQLAMAGAPVGLVLTTRPLAQAASLVKGIHRLQRSGALLCFDLEPLDEDDSRRLVTHAALAPLPEPLVARIVQAADGNAFALIELARCARPVDPGRLPGGTAEAIAERLCDVPAGALALLRWMALGGEVLDVGIIEVLALQAEVPLLASLDEALDAGVLVLAGAGYRFRHELVRQALLAQVPPHRRVAMHRALATALAPAGMAPCLVARHWQAGGRPREALSWWLQAARDAVRLAAFGDALHHLAPVLEVEPVQAEALRLRAESLDAMGDPAALAAYRLAADAAGEPGCHDLRAKAALAQVKLGDPKGALLALEGVHPTTVEGRLCEALAYSGAAALGVADPAIGTAKSSVARRLALESGDTASLVVASWAQAAAAHARGELHASVIADLQETSQVPHLALRVFDGHLCITQRFLYGARPYAQVIAFAEALATQALRLGAARGHAFGVTLRGEAELLSGDLTAAREHLTEGARLHRAISGPVGEALSLQRLSELALHEGRREDARALIDDALDVARQTDIGFHLLDRIYGTRIQLHADDPAAALHVMEDASESVRGPLETCPGCRITFAVPAAIAAARAGEVELADRHETQCAYLANVVMRLPAWHAAHDEVLGHLARARGRPADDALARFAAASARFRQAGHRLDAERCERLAAGGGPARY